MARLIFCVLFACFTLRATTFVFTTCSAGTTVATPCPAGGLTGPNYNVSAQATATEGPQSSSIFPPLFPDLPGGQQQSAMTDVVASNGPPFLSLSADAQASASTTYESSGSLRSGFIEFEVAFNYPHEDSFSQMALLTDGTHEYSYAGSNGSTMPTHCFIEDCEYIATQPFELGTQFQVSVSSLSQGVPAANPFAGNGSSQVLFRLLEADETTLAPFTAVPEPTSVTLMLLAAALGVCFARERHHFDENRRPD